MDKLIEQARNKGNWNLVEHLHFLDFVMNKMIELEELVKTKKQSN